MAKGSSRKRLNKSENVRKPKKKISPLSSDDIQYVDYKDTDLLKRFMSDRAKIRTRRVTGNDSQQQREIARAIKNAREMGLLAYTSRVTTQRRGGGGRRNDRGDKGDRGDRGDRSSNRESSPAETEAVTEAEATFSETDVTTSASSEESVEA